MFKIVTSSTKKNRLAQRVVSIENGDDVAKSDLFI